jgi:hypothetical protein
MSVALPPQASGGIQVELPGPAARATLTVAAHNSDAEIELTVNDQPCGTYPLKAVAGPASVEIELPTGADPTIRLTITNTAPRVTGAFVELIDATFHP